MSPNPLNLFDSIQVSNFRSLVDIDVSLKPLTVLFGENGAGTTSLLDVWSLLSAATCGELSHAVENFGGISELLTHQFTQSDSTTDELSVMVTMSHAGEEPLLYEIALQRDRESFWISKERLIQRDSRILMNFLEPVHLSVGPFMSRDNTIAKLGCFVAVDEQPQLFTARLKAAVHMATIDVSHNSPVRLPQQALSVISPGTHGESLASFLYLLRENHADRFEMLSDILHDTFADFEQLDFSINTAGDILLLWKNSHFRQPISLQALPGGSLRFLWWAAILLNPNLPDFLLIDEPELSLHPRLLM